MIQGVDILGYDGYSPVGRSDMIMAVLADNGFSLQTRVRDLDEAMQSLEQREIMGIPMICVQRPDGEGIAAVREDRVLAIIVQDESQIAVPAPPGNNGMRVAR